MATDIAPVSTLDFYLKTMWDQATDPEPVAENIWHIGWTVAQTKASIKRLIKSGDIVTDNMSEWEGDVITAVRWAYKHDRSPALPFTDPL